MADRQTRHKGDRDRVTERDKERERREEGTGFSGKGQMKNRWEGRLQTYGLTDSLGTIHISSFLSFIFIDTRLNECVIA
jgi:hypothetical protein